MPKWKTTWMSVLSVFAIMGVYYHHHEIYGKKNIKPPFKFVYRFDFIYQAFPFCSFHETFFKTFFFFFFFEILHVATSYTTPLCVPSSDQQPLFGGAAKQCMLSLKINYADEQLECSSDLHILPTLFLEEPWCGLTHQETDVSIVCCDCFFFFLFCFFLL